MQYDLMIIGGGPAGIAAGVYASRKKLSTILVTDSFGGQSIVSEEIQNWVGTPSISGLDLAKQLEAHLRMQKNIEISEGDRVAKVEETNNVFQVTTEKEIKWESRAVLVASGSRRRHLGVPGEDQFEGKGVVYCVTCDAPLFEGKRVVVIGGGNAGLESAMNLTSYAEEITILEGFGQLKGDPVTQEKLRANPKVHIVFNAQVKKILGDAFVSGIQYLDTKTNEERELPLEGVFVEIGSVPNSECVKGLVDVDSYGYIIVDQSTQTTSKKGIWAAGDVSNGLYKQNNISAGDGVKAVMHIYETLAIK